MKKILTICGIVAICLLCLWLPTLDLSNNSTEETLDEDEYWKQVHKDGYNYGYNDGYDSGYDAGYDAGYDEGYRDGYYKNDR